jgi:hypothetical protein
MGRSQRLGGHRPAGTAPLYARMRRSRATAPAKGKRPRLPTSALGGGPGRWRGWSRGPQRGRRHDSPQDATVGAVLRDDLLPALNMTVTTEVEAAIPTVGGVTASGLSGCADTDDAPADRRRSRDHGRARPYGSRSRLHGSAAGAGHPICDPAAPRRIVARPGRLAGRDPPCARPCRRGVPSARPGCCRSPARRRHGPLDPLART